MKSKEWKKYGLRNKLAKEVPNEILYMDIGKKKRQGKNNKWLINNNAKKVFRILLNMSHSSVALQINLQWSQISKLTEFSRKSARQCISTKIPKIKNKIRKDNIEKDHLNSMSSEISL